MATIAAQAKSNITIEIEQERLFSSWWHFKLWATNYFKMNHKPKNDTM